MINSPGGIKTKLGLPSGKYRNILGSRKKYWDSAFGLTQYFFLSPNIFLYLPAFRPNLLYYPPSEGCSLINLTMRLRRYPPWDCKQKIDIRSQICIRKVILGRRFCIKIDIRSQNLYKNQYLVAKLIKNDIRSQILYKNRY